MLTNVNRGRPAALLETTISLVVTSTLIPAFTGRGRSTAILVWKPIKMMVALLETHVSLEVTSTLTLTGVSRGRTPSPLFFVSSGSSVDGPQSGALTPATAFRLLSASSTS